MSTPPVTVFATFRPSPARAGALRETLDMMIEHTRKESGCLTYDLYRSGTTDEPVFHLFERYTDPAALEAHRRADYYVRYRAALPDLLRQPVEVAILDEVDVAR